MAKRKLNNDFNDFRKQKPKKPWEFMEQKEGRGFRQKPQPKKAKKKEKNPFKSNEVKVEFKVPFPFPEFDVQFHGRFERPENKEVKGVKPEAEQIGLTRENVEYIFNKITHLNNHYRIVLRSEDKAGWSPFDMTPNIPDTDRIVLIRRVPCSSTGNPMDLRHIGEPIKINEMTEQKLVKEILCLMTEFEVHEFLEFFKYENEIFFHPHKSQFRNFRMMECVRAGIMHNETKEEMESFVVRDHIEANFCLKAAQNPFSISEEPKPTKKPSRWKRFKTGLKIMASALKKS